MTIYEELEQMERDALDGFSVSSNSEGRNFYAGMRLAIEQARELFDKRERPERYVAGFVTSYYDADDVADFLPPERK